MRSQPEQGSTVKSTRKTWQPIATALAVIAICVGSVGLRDTFQSAQPVAMASSTTVPMTPMPPATDEPAYPAAQPIPSYELEEREALGYLRSTERAQRFADDFKKAGTLIAQGLDTGKFAPTTKRYNSAKSNRQPGYRGWGGISTHDNGYYAWVYWNCNGSINYKMGVTGLSITDGYTRLQIEMMDQGDGPYKVFLSTGEGPTRITSTSYSTGSVTESVHDFVRPRSLIDLKWLDDDALAALNSLMIQNFGIDWRQLR